MLRLTQIELLGFKSFPHRTVVDVDHGITCVVGPNGSGKSNLADAVNFAFGSQSGRELRARRLASLIFAGTDQLRPLNIASVTLHFERTAADLAFAEDSLAGLSALAEDELELPETAVARQPVGSQLSHGKGFSGLMLTRHIAGPQAKEVDRTPEIIRQLSELRPGQRISLTRRAFRDGSGGYYVNDQPVRLKDIDALFDRFNLGRAAIYSIGQGEVEQKVLESPQQLREWLAEATGVALLLMQKQRAQHKLKRTRSNLERLEDVRSATRELVEDLAKEYSLGISGYFGEIYSNVTYFPAVGTKIDTLLEHLSGLKPGLNLLVMHVGQDTPELQAMKDQNPFGLSGMSKHRQDELNCLISDEFKNAVQSYDLKPINYRDVLESIGLDKMVRPDMNEYK